MDAPKPEDGWDSEPPSPVPVVVLVLPKPFQPPEPNGAGASDGAVVVVVVGAAPHWRESREGVVVDVVAAAEKGLGLAPKPPRPVDVVEPGAVDAAGAEDPKPPSEGVEEMLAAAEVPPKPLRDGAEDEAVRPAVAAVVVAAGVEKPPKLPSSFGAVLVVEAAWPAVLKAEGLFEKADKLLRITSGAIT